MNTGMFAREETKQQSLDSIPGNNNIILLEKAQGN
jgi:hypothetical protein